MYMILTALRDLDTISETSILKSMIQVLSSVRTRDCRNDPSSKYCNSTP